MTAGPLVRQVTSKATTMLPRGVLAGARGMARTWGLLTADARMLPGLIIVGAQRCGTTTLFRVLSEHPSVVRPTQSKGIGYFDLNHHRGLRWYRGHFPLRPVAALRTPRGVRPITFESSGYYSFHPAAPARIGTALPGVRLVLMVRNPVDRAYSAHQHESVRGFETETFERALELEPARLAGEVERILTEPGYESVSHRHHAYLGRGRYAEQLERLRVAVGDDGVFVMDADDFFADPATSFSSLQEWLGLPIWVPDRVDQWNARVRAPLDPALRSRLMDYFAPYDERLEALTGSRPSWRR